MQRRRTNSSHTVLVFKHRRRAEEAVRALLGAGIGAERISVFLRAPADPNASQEEFDSAVDSGGAIGAGVGALASLGLFAIPGIGPVLGAGTVASALATAILGSCFGGFAGALTSAGLSERSAALAERHLREGKAVVVVRNEGDRQKLSTIAHSQGSVQVATV